MAEGSRCERICKHPASTRAPPLAKIRALFADAVEEGVLRHSPTTGIRVAVRKPVEDEAAKAMTRAQLARLLGEDWRLFFEFLAHTGLRISEAIEVRWGRDLELDDRTTLKLGRQYTDGVVRAPKSAAGRRDLPLSAGMAARLRAIEGPTGTLAFTTTTGKRLNRSNPLPRRPPPRRHPRRRALGVVPQLPPHMRLAALRGRQERQARASATPTSSTTSWVIRP